MHWALTICLLYPQAWRGASRHDPRKFARKNWRLQIVSSWQACAEPWQGPQGVGSPGETSMVQ